MRKVILVGFAVAVVGCSSKGTLTADQKQSLISEYNQQKTFEIECTTGCRVAYKDPRDQLQLPSETNGYDVLNTAIKTVGGIATSAMPYAAIGVVATEGIRNAGGNGSNNSSAYNASYENDTSTATTTETSTNTSTQTESAVNSSYNERVPIAPEE